MKDDIDKIVDLLLTNDISNIKLAHQLIIGFNNLREVIVKLLNHPKSFAYHDIHNTSGSIWFNYYFNILSYDFFRIAYVPTIDEYITLYLDNRGRYDFETDCQTDWNEIQLNNLLNELERNILEYFEELY
jgi:hypothetical protein